jgi:FlaA1/EpsC-like NDP-sugar epimerase
MVELVRDVRSTLGLYRRRFQHLCHRLRHVQYDALIKWAGGYDYVLNLSALKHVRSEKTLHLMRMVDVNVLNTISTIESAKFGAKKYFCVSTDKAANPVNMMGASKRIMEMFLMRASESPYFHRAFANVAFSDGSLLHGFNQRFAKRQPISAPKDVRRYFVTPRSPASCA